MGCKELLEGSTPQKGWRGKARSSSKSGQRLGQEQFERRFFLQENTADMMDMDCIERKSFVTVMVWWGGEHDY